MNRPIALVTGGGRGIGRAICRRFAADGYLVVAAARTQSQLDETQKLIEAECGSCETILTNVASLDDVQAMIDFTVNECGGLDVLVNNAGVAPNNDLESFDTTVFDSMIGVNVSGVFYACRAAWPAMRKRGGGTIINISSMAAVDPFPGFAAYGASKAFVELLTKALAKEGAEHGIRVYAVGPGAVDTQMLRGPFPDFPANQCLQPDDIAEMVFQMTTPACRYSVGQTIYVNNT